MNNVITEVSQADLDQLIELVNKHRERTGESVTAIAERAGVGRSVFNRILTGSYPHSPQFDVVARIANSIGFHIEFKRN